MCKSHMYSVVSFVISLYSSDIDTQRLRLTIIESIMYNYTGAVRIYTEDIPISICIYIYIRLRKPRERITQILL